MNNLLFSRVAFTLFGLDIYWYGIIITFAIALDFFLLFMLCKKRGLSSDVPYDLVLFLIPLGIIGARLFSVIFDPDMSLADFFAFRSGGMSIIGSIIGGAGGMLLYCKLKKQKFFEMTDLISPLLILAQAIGRWGNFFNNEVYGQRIVDESLQWFPLAVNINGYWYQALFFYESVLNLIGFALLITLLSVKNKKAGIVTATYFVFYGIVRFFMEGLRQEEYVLKLGSLPISKILSGVMVLVGLAIFIYIIVSSVKANKINKEVNNGKEQTNTI